MTYESTWRICPACQKQIRETAEFCKYCGRVFVTPLVRTLAELAQFRVTLAETEKILAHLTGQNDSLIERLDEAERKLAECQAKEAEAMEIAKIYRGLWYEHPWSCKDYQKLQVNNLDHISKVLIPQAELDALRKVAEKAKEYQRERNLHLRDSLCCQDCKDRLIRLVKALSNLDRAKEEK